MVRTGGLWGLVFGLYVYDNAFGFDAIAPDRRQRDKLLSAIASNTGLKALIGDTHRITTSGGFTDWRAIGVTALVVSVWGLLAATKALRGEEAAGRWELFLAGQTTARRAAANALAGLGAGVRRMYVVTSLLTAVGRRQAGCGDQRRPEPVLRAGGGGERGHVPARRRGGQRGDAHPVPRRRRWPPRRSGWPSCCAPSATPRQRALARVCQPARLGGAAAPATGAQPLWLVPIAALTAGAPWSRCCWPTATSAPACWPTRTPRPPAGPAELPGPVRAALSWAAIVSWLAAAAVAGLLYGSFAKSPARRSPPPACSGSSPAT